MGINNNFFPYNQLLPRGHPTIMNTPIIRTAAKSQAKINFRCVTQINNLLLLGTLAKADTNSRSQQCSL